MVKVHSKIAAHLGAKLKQFQPIVSSAKARDVNESDTVIIVTDVLSELFGYDKYSEITSEHAIRGTYCDLAIKIEGKVKLLIEVKAIGLDLKEAHIKQAVDYAANKGVEWVVLTNGMIWQVFKVYFAKPISQSLAAEIDLLKLNHRSKADVEYLYILSRTALLDAALEEFHTQSLATSRFIIGQLLLNENVLKAIRRELKSFFPDIRVEISEIQDTLQQGVLKREVIDSEDALDAVRLLKKAASKKARTKKPKPDLIPQATPLTPETIAETPLLERPSYGDTSVIEHEDEF